MAISKIILNGVTQMDLTADTVAAENLLSSYTAHGADGEAIVGTASSGSSVQTETGTVSGTGTTTLSVSCSFAPDLIYLYGDLSGSTNLRGVISITIIKDTYISQTADTSSSSAVENVVYLEHGITGYNESNTDYPHASYSNGVLTFDTVTNTSSNRFTSGITYSYKLVKWTA